MCAETNRATVLVIDDELGPRESLRMLLKTEYEVICASSVDDGVRVLRERRPDLIIMDIRMPDKNGIQGLGEIRALDTQISVVMLTGHGQLETAQQAIRLGATDYLSKPFDTKEMQKTVRRYVQRTKLEKRRSCMLEELRNMNSRLIDELSSKERLASVGQTSAEFLHDLRNPLTIISGYVELLSKEIEKSRVMNGQATGYLDVIEQNVRRCCDLATLWQKFAKSETPMPRPLRMIQVMEDIQAAAAPLASTENVTIEFANEAPDASVHGTAAQLVRALHNLVSNAIQAAPANGSVRVTFRRDGENIEVLVEDNGPGMTADVKARVFEPYFTTKSEKNGTGLGMSIAKKIVEEHRGRIEIESEPGRGTRISVRIPLLKSAPFAAAGQ